MRELIIGMWSTLLWRGALSVVFGICAFVWPGNFMEVLVIVFGFYLLVDGIMAMWGAYIDKGEDRSRFLPIAIAFTTISIGLLALISPPVVIRYILLLIGIWNIYLGLLQIFTSFVLRRELQNSGWQAFAGVISILFGIAIAYYWWVGVVTLAWLIGIAAITTGLILLWLGFTLRRVGKRMTSRA